VTLPRDRTRPRRMSRDAYRAALDDLIRSKGLERFALYDTTIEGRVYPNGMDETSGSVVDDRGRAFDFWTGWDDERGEPTFRFWHEAVPRTRGTSERRARERLGLPD
jgi:hypothetical protein